MLHSPTSQLPTLKAGLESLPGFTDYKKLDIGWIYKKLFLQDFLPYAKGPLSKTKDLRRKQCRDKVTEGIEPLTICSTGGGLVIYTA